MREYWQQQTVNLLDEHLLNDELMLLITLSWLVAFLVCPTNLSLAAFARNVADTVKPSH